MVKKHRFMTSQGIDLIKQIESFFSAPYWDYKGFSIGYGHLIKNGESFTSITENEGEKILRKDLFASERAVLRFISVSLTDGQFDALCSFTFNLGGGALQRSTLRQKLNRGEDKEDIAPEFLRWVRAGGKILRGLIKRRQIEMELFLA